MRQHSRQHSRQPIRQHPLENQITQTGPRRTHTGPKPHHSQPTLSKHIKPSLFFFRSASHPFQSQRPRLIKHPKKTPNAQSRKPHPPIPSIRPPRLQLHNHPPPTSQTAPLNPRTIQHTPPSSQDLSRGPRHMQPHLHARAAAVLDGMMQANGSGRLEVLYPVEALQDAHDEVGSFGLAELLCRKS